MYIYTYIYILYIYECVCASCVSKSINRLRNWWTVTQRCQYLVVLVPLGHPTTVGTRYCIVLQRVILDWLWGGPNFHTSVEDWRNWNFQCRANLLQSSWVHLFWWAGLHLEHVVLSHISTIYIYKETPTDLPKSNGGSSLDEMTMKSIGWFLRMRQFSMWYYFQYPNVSKLMDGIPLGSLWATGSSVLVGRITLRTRCSFPHLYYIYI